ncbi:MAG: PLDc N-terminal domain-containing protein [Actinomycetota bacterium]
MVRPRLRRPFALAFLLVLVVPAWARGQEESSARIEAIDNVFSPRIVRIPVGGTVEWTNDGRSIHDVTADDGSVSSGDLEPGGSFILTFPTAGAFAYHCSYHGSPGAGMVGVVLVGGTIPPGPIGGVGPGREPPPAIPGPTVRVPQDRPTIQEAVDEAEPGGLVLISPGVYEEAVVVTTPFLTIRGADRNKVILDGAFRLDNGIQVIEADGVAIENMTARHYLLNGFLWSSVYGYRGSYLTAYNDGDYGIFAYDSRYGQLEHSYASGHPDAGFYIGQCDPCHAVITDVLAENNALGFSGTNASGDLAIINSEWRDNMNGILPNTLDTEELPPQHDILIAGNWVHDNGNRDAPAESLQYAAFGTGIAITGGRGNVVTENLVEGHERFGIQVFPMADENLWVTEDNQITDNVVRDSGIGDLALSAPSGGGDCFSGNDFSTSLPPAIEQQFGCGFSPNALGGGNLGSTFDTLVRFVQGGSGDFPHGDWRTAPEPPRQPRMSRARNAPPDPAVAEIAVPEPLPRIRDARTLVARPSDRIDQEVTVLGFPIATTWWGLLIGLYGYALPLILYSAWVSIALWDLVRQDLLPDRMRVVWMAVVLLIPLLGPIGYYAIGRSPIQRSLRWMLVAGGLGVYVLLAALGFVIGSG